MRIIQISDTHVSHLGGVSNDNLDLAIDLINDLARDFVVHTGDVTILDPDEDRDRVTAQQLLARIEAPMRVLPGNHDVGEPGPQPFGGKSTTGERGAAFTAHFGEDRFIEHVGDWSVVGCNSELFGTGLPEEEAQWAWLEELPAKVEGRPVILFTHKPIWAHQPELQGPQLAYDAGVLPRIETILDRLDVKAFGSGHLHQYQLTRRGEAHTVSAPSTAFVHRSPKMTEYAGLGLAQLGIVSYEIDGSEVQPYFRTRTDFTEGDMMESEAARRAVEAMGIVLGEL